MIGEMSESEKQLLERRERIARMTNADLFDAYEQSIITLVKDDGKHPEEYQGLYRELEKRLQRTGFLPLPDRLLEIRQARTVK